MTEEDGSVRILRIINRFNLGGPTYNVAYLTKHLEKPFETKLVGGEKDESEASSSFILDKLSITGEVIPEMRRSINPFQDLLAYWSIRKIIKKYKPHIVHTHAAKAGTLGRLAAIHAGVPIVLHTFHGHVFHSYFGKVKTNIFKAIERYLAAKSSGIVCISAQQKREIGTEHSICNPEKIRVIPLGFDLDRFQNDQVQKRTSFRAKYKLEEDEVAIGIVGRLVPVKNHPMFLRAAKALTEQDDASKYRFFIIGDGESKEDLTNWCDEHGLRYRWKEAPSKAAPVCFTSWIKDVDEVYAGLDIVCLTSLNEGTPVSLIEAQSAAKPVISTQVGGVEDIVENGKGGWLCGVQDDHSFQLRLFELAKDATMRKSFGDYGRGSVIEKYHFSRLVNDMSVYYHNLLKEKSIQVQS